MTNSDFEKAILEQISTCQHLLEGKGAEYADNVDIDRLNHFKLAAALMEVDPKIALMGMFSKHIVSISKMCMNGMAYSQATWDEKITDSINYLLILSAMVKEEKANEKYRNRNT